MTSHISKASVLLCVSPASGSLVEESILSRCWFLFHYWRPNILPGGPLTSAHMAHRILINQYLFATHLVRWYGHWDSNPENHGPKPCGYSNSPMPANLSPLIFDNRRNGTLKPPGDMDNRNYCWKSPKGRWRGLRDLNPRPAA